MTEPHDPQKKYIITEAQIERYRLETLIVPDDLKVTAAEEIRSQPHLGAEKVLEELIESISKLHQFQNDTGLVYLSDVLYQIELREREGR